MASSDCSTALCRMVKAPNTNSPNYHGCTYFAQSSFKVLSPGIRARHDEDLRYGDGESLNSQGYVSSDTRFMIDSFEVQERNWN